MTREQECQTQTWYRVDQIQWGQKTWGWLRNPHRQSRRPKWCTTPDKSNIIWKSLEEVKEKHWKKSTRAGVRTLKMSTVTILIKKASRDWPQYWQRFWTGAYCTGWALAPCAQSSDRTSAPSSTWLAETSLEANSMQPKWKNINMENNVFHLRYLNHPFLSLSCTCAVLSPSLPTPTPYPTRISSTYSAASFRRWRRAAPSWPSSAQTARVTCPADRTVPPCDTGPNAASWVYIYNRKGMGLEVGWDEMGWVAKRSQRSLS